MSRCQHSTANLDAPFGGRSSPSEGIASKFCAFNPRPSAEEWSATMTAFFTDFAERNARTGRPSPTPLEIQRAVLPRRDASEATTAAAPDNRCADPRVGRGRLKPKTRGNARSPAEGPPPSSALFVPAGDLGPEQQWSIKCRRGLFQSPPSTCTRLPVFGGAGCDRSWRRFSVFGPSAVAKGGTSRKSRISARRGNRRSTRRVSHFGDRNDL